jgi:cobalt/nickel transport system permease protein
VAANWYYLIDHYAFRTLLRTDWDVFSAGAGAATLGLSAGTILIGAIIVISGVNGSALPRTDLTIAVVGLVGLNLGAAVAEGVLTGFVVQFLASVRPDLVGFVDLGRGIVVAGPIRKGGLARRRRTELNPP